MCSKRNAAQISDAHVTFDTDLDVEADIAVTNAKPSIGKTGVHLLAHNSQEAGLHAGMLQANTLSRHVRRHRDSNDG